MVGRYANCQEARCCDALFCAKGECTVWGSRLHSYHCHYHRRHHLRYHPHHHHNIIFIIIIHSHYLPCLHSYHRHHCHISYHGNCHYLQHFHCHLHQYHHHIYIPIRRSVIKKWSLPFLSTTFDF